MEQSGITRRIDELGRIVIPKEIRRNMHIKKGELLEIYLQSEDSLVLKKHMLMSKKDEFINIFLKTLSTVLNSTIYLTNLNEIIFSSTSNSVGQKLSSVFDKIIARGTITDIKIDNIKLSDDIILKSPFKMYPILPNGDLVGVLIIDQNKTLELDKNVVKLSVSVIESFFENN